MLGMEPQVRYARAGDGVKIAWYSIGDGLAYVWPATPQGSGLVDAWHVPELRAVLEGIARRARLVVFDPRGFGLSDRSTTDFTRDAMVGDLEAVTEAAEVDSFTLQTFGYFSIPAVAFAARYPDRISALVLLNGLLRGADLSDSWKRLTRLAEEDWHVASALIARTNEASYTATVTLEQTEELFRRGASQEAFVAFSRAMADWDASDVAGSVVAPAIVVHYGAATMYTPLEASRRLAAALPNGTFTPIEFAGGAAMRVDHVTDVVRDYLRGAVPRQTREQLPRPPSSSTGTAVIIFTDIADSTALNERVGDTAFRKSSRALDDRVRTAIRDAGGMPVEGTVLGDGVMGVFSSAAQAIASALASVRAADALGLQLHVGVHAGDVIYEQSNVYGGAVNIASRICAACQPGEILVSATVRDLARTSAGVTFEDRGESAFKGISDLVRVFAVLPPKE